MDSRFIGCWGDSLTEQGYARYLGKYTGRAVLNYGLSSNTAFGVACRYGAIPMFYMPQKLSSDLVRLHPAAPGPLQGFSDQESEVRLEASLGGNWGHFQWDGRSAYFRYHDAVDPEPLMSRLHPLPRPQCGTEIDLSLLYEIPIVIWIGTNNLHRGDYTPGFILDCVKAMARRLRPGVWFSVMPLINGPNDCRGSIGYERIIETNRLLRQHFPTNLVQVDGLDGRELAIKHALAASFDASAAERDHIPSCFMADDVHLTLGHGGGYDIVARLIAESLIERGVVDRQSTDSI